MSIAVGLVGFGLSARVLHRPLIEAAGMNIVAVVTRQVQALQNALPAAQALPDLEALLALPRLDLVVIATPNHLHFPQALAALRAGKHVVIDKPMALSTEECDRLIEAAAARPLVLSVFHNRRWDSDFLTLRRLIERDALGALVAFEARWDRYRPTVPDRWRERPGCGGGVLYDLGAHLIDQALCLFGLPEWIEADVFAQRAGAQADDALRVGVVRIPGPDLLDRRLVDMGGGVEVGFTDVQSDDVHAAGHASGDVLADAEGILGPERTDSLSEKSHVRVVSPVMRCMVIARWGVPDPAIDPGPPLTARVPRQMFVALLTAVQHDKLALH